MAEAEGKNLEDEDDHRELGKTVSFAAYNVDDLREPHAFDDLNDSEVIQLVANMEEECRHLKLENFIFYNFLKKNDPLSTEGLSTALENVPRMLETYKNHQHNLSPRRTIELSEKGSIQVSSGTLSMLLEGRGPRINLTQKTDMAMREMEDTQTKLEAFMQKSHRTKCNLKASLEEIGIRNSEIKESSEKFEETVVEEGFDRLTQRIPAEKFVRYMEEWLKIAQQTIEKLRLRIATFRVQFKKVSVQLVQRQELGENVHPVDFDQLIIENSHFSKKIDQKNIHLVELKKMNGGANLILSMHKKYIQKQLEDFNKLKENIGAKELNIQEITRECESVSTEVIKAKEECDYFIKMKQTYKVPEVIEYVKTKAQLYDLNKNKKIWERRKKIQDIALNACIREMKNVTGSSTVKEEWFEEFRVDDPTSLDPNAFVLNL